MSQSLSPARNNLRLTDERSPTAESPPPKLNFMANLMGEVNAARKSGLTAPSKSVNESGEKEGWDDVMSG